MGWALSQGLSCSWDPDYALPSGSHLPGGLRINAGSQDPHSGQSEDLASPGTMGLSMTVGHSEWWGPGALRVPLMLSAKRPPHGPESPCSLYFPTVLIWPLGGSRGH